MSAVRPRTSTDLPHAPSPTPGPPLSSPFAGSPFGSILLREPILIGCAIVVGLCLTRLYSYDLFHSLVEIFSVVIACAVFLFAWNSRRLAANDYLLVIGIAYLFTGAIDLVHTLAYKGMGVFGGLDSNLPTQLWIGARYLEALSLLVAPWFLRRGSTGTALRTEAIFAVYLAVVGAFFVSVFYLRIFPACYVEGQGLTPFKVASEYVISMILVGAALLLRQRRERFERDIYLLLTASIGVTIAQELAFTLYTDPYNLTNMLGHVLKIVSYYLVYRAIIATGLVKPYSLLLRDLEQTSEQQKRLVAQLRDANGRLVDAYVRIEQQAKTAEHDAAHLRELEQAREEFLRAITHDLRNPLTGVLGNAQLMLRYADRPEAVRRQADTIVESARRMNSMLGDLVDSLRIEAGRMAPDLQSVGLRDLLLDLEERSGGGEQRGLVRADLPEDVPAVQADPRMLERILANLVSNALKYGREGADVVVTVAPGDGKVVVSVADEGPGIAPEHLPRIFDRYYRVATGSERREGLGLGLYITRGLVEAMGGRIWVESQEGKGSTFSFALPLARALEEGR